MNQLVNTVLGTKAVRIACQAVIKEYPNRLSHSNYDRVHTLITSFVGEIVSIATMAGPPRVTQKHPERVNFVTLFTQEKEFDIDEQIKQSCRELSLLGVSYVSIAMKKLADTVLAETLRLLGWP